MPRRDYKRHFARDRDGNYVGTEPEREWYEDDLEREFGQYQSMALRSVPDEKVMRRDSVASAAGRRSGGESVDGEQGVQRRDVTKDARKNEEEWWL